MAFTKAQYEEIRTFVDNGQIDIARRLLEEINDEKARLLLDKLNQKYPLTLTDAKRLLGQQRYEEAETVLWNLDNPEATTLLEKLTLVKKKMKTAAVDSSSPKQGASSSPFIAASRPSPSSINTKNKLQPQRSASLSLSTIVTVCGGIILVILLVILVQVVQQRQRPTVVQAALKEVCIKLTRLSPEPGQEDQTPEQIAADCGAAAQELYEESTDIANACYDMAVDKNDALEWTSCLMDRLEPEYQEEARSF